MRFFRFVTSVLIGPWRKSREQAVSDAVEARQAVRSSHAPEGLEWRVPGHIEETSREDASAAGRPRPR